MPNDYRTVTREKRCPCGEVWEGPVIAAFAPPEGEAISAECQACVDAANARITARTESPEKAEHVKAEQMQFPPIDVEEEDVIT